MQTSYKKLPFRRDGWTLFLDTEAARLAWEKTDSRMDELRPGSVAVLEDDYSRDPVKACRRALSLTRDVSENDRLEVCNALLGMHGTEAIRGEWQNGYWCDIVAAYCNAGDAYDITIMQIRPECSFRASRFIVSSYGDWIERNGEKMGVQ